ncbi:TIGR01244 family sulfur transferase [Zavarzinia compransoris]|uniref:TIGR01244 family phosphatase n=1 Tax=Zavarzinia compransoris TaxID=1264899 RepID=A0A317DYZ6_9PROT|nr:TIGR01244 family sulfur transferase [Zavarzinia compransoris]PWR19642.1 TIGR01244 family phosphatase [Zavarzinia compransoris]TDP43416.1 sulfide:quinone oxidoreductase [Zavarzinia compransoris]
MPDLKALAPDLAVTGQIGPGDLPALAAAGYRMMIVNRPDGEDPGQPSFADMAAAAEAVGIAARHIPIASAAAATDGDAAAFEAARAAAGGGRVLAYCRTGNRSAVLWALGQRGRRAADTVIAEAAAAGCDLTALKPRL